MDEIFQGFRNMEKLSKVASYGVLSIPEIAKIALRDHGISLIFSYFDNKST